MGKIEPHALFECSGDISRNPFFWLNIPRNLFWRARDDQQISYDVWVRLLKFGNFVQRFFARAYVKKREEKWCLVG